MDFNSLEKLIYFIAVLAIAGFTWVLALYINYLVENYKLKK
jgi:hypothetical protein